MDIGKTLEDFVIEGEQIVVKENPIDNEPQFNLIVEQPDSLRP